MKLEFRFVYYKVINFRLICSTSARYTYLSMRYMFAGVTLAMIKVS